MFSLTLVMDNFTVHLVSNVSPGLFPDNNASKFSTNLATELDLSEGEWEVGVRQIMYPTRISTTTDGDEIHIFKYKDNYRDLLPVPSKKEIDMEKIGTSIDLYPPDGKTSDIVQHLLKTVNDSVWAKEKGILKMEYDKSTNKFIFHIFKEDIVIWMSKNTRKFLGFRKNQHSFTKGTFWTYKWFDKNASPSSKLKLYLCDLRTLEKETYQLTMSWDSKRNQYCYRRIIQNKYHDSTPPEKYQYSSFAFGVHPHDGFIKMQDMQQRWHLTDHKKYVKKIAFFEFNSLAVNELKLNAFYCANDFVEVKNKLNTEIPPPNYYINISKLPVVVNETFANDTNHIALQNIYVTVYYNSVIDLTGDLEEKPTATFAINSEKEIEDPSEILPHLNAMKSMYDYTFSYDTVSKRFEVRIDGNIAIQLTKTLSSILGFNTTEHFHSKSVHRASNFPLIQRAITALYVYSNILDSVYIGDVKAPLLLTCPFKKSNSINIVEQQEFLNPCYAPLNRARVNQIDIAIYDDAGSLIPFLYGKTKLSLDFRRKR